MKKAIVASAPLTVLAVAVPLNGGAGAASGVPPASSGAFAQQADFDEAGLPGNGLSSLAFSIRTSMVDRMADTIRLLWRLEKWDRKLDKILDR